MVDVGEISISEDVLNNYLEGEDGYYRHLANGLGIKVIRRGSLKNAQSEYLINLYLQNHDLLRGRTSEVLACGMVSVEYKGKWNHHRPVIWMKNIEGIRCDHHATRLGLKQNPYLSPLEAQNLGYSCEEYQLLINKMDDLYNLLKEVGYSGWDHEFYQNYMYCPNGIIKAIDFKPLKDLSGNIIEKRSFIKECYEKYQHHLSITLPLQYIETLQYLGYVTK